ncbi:hypothetical protein Q0F99_10990 [Rathayibacter oskolensis]|uniref:hypothetical protein n=1 Tax=Rathayibacter oskolensis TaxID=1891671 RepID=UPI00265D9B14|nr:hypothetical protein [Rathayibacter oskolensis]WKK70407.1 hypothetical protein Q0F99_10990 [Rathayibacter oskolensis]
MVVALLAAIVLALVLQGQFVSIVRQSEATLAEADLAAYESDLRTNPTETLTSRPRGSSSPSGRPTGTCRSTRCRTTSTR